MELCDCCHKNIKDLDNYVSPIIKYLGLDLCKKCGKNFMKDIKSTMYRYKQK